MIKRGTRTFKKSIYEIQIKSVNRPAIRHKFAEERLVQGAEFPPCGHAANCAKIKGRDGAQVATGWRGVQGVTLASNPQLQVVK